MFEKRARSFHVFAAGAMAGLLGTLLAASAAQERPAARSARDQPAAPIVARMQAEARALRPLVSSDLARQFLDATARIADSEPRVIFHDGRLDEYFSEADARRLPEARREQLEKVEVSPSGYYLTRYGTPLAYTRMIDLIGQAGLSSAEGRKVLDFGYGTIGHLRLLAGSGAEVAGIDVDSYLAALYSQESDQGVVSNQEGRDGRVTLIDGRWPASARARGSVGGGYDLFMSKNTLKRGFIHPEREVDPKRLVRLGVDDAEFCAAVHGILRPGGLAIIYNLSPAPAPPDEPFKPWADGRCPFARADWEAAGFEVLAYDVDDTEAARRMARALGWDRGEPKMDLENDLFGTYTLLRKKPGG